MIDQMNALASQIKPATAVSVPVVEAKGLGLTFETNDGPVHALSNVNLTINKGDFVSFIGPSGCGKTTFLRTIADLEQPTAGTLSVNSMTPRQAREARAYGYVFQAAALLPWRTIERNVALPLEVMGFSRTDVAERIHRTLELVNLTGFEKKYPWQLSGGMQQRASIARALAFDADLLLMDEPFGALDSQTRLMMQELVLQLWMEFQPTIIFITHDVAEAIFVSDRILLMSSRPGRVKLAVSVAEPKPRSQEFLASANFIDLQASLLKALKQEVH